MRNYTQHLVIFGLFILLSLQPISKAAEEGFYPPQQVIQSISDTLQQKLQDKAFRENFLQVTQFVNGVIGPHTDFDKIAPLVLGKYWKTASATEQARFKEEFQTLLVRVYSRVFVEYHDWVIRYQPVDMASDAKKVVIKTKVMQPGIQPIEVNYRMLLDNDGWKVYDILIDGASLVTTYRSSFSGEIQAKGSLTAVIDMLVKRNAEALAKGT